MRRTAASATYEKGQAKSENTTSGTAAMLQPLPGENAREGANLPRVPVVRNPASACTGE
jgi:hypothetical protein